MRTYSSPPYIPLFRSLLPLTQSLAVDGTALCNSFCCALDKFALDPATRAAVLDSGCIASFPALCAMSGRNFARLAQFLYSVSCSAELVPPLVFQHDCIKVITAVLGPHPSDEGEGGRDEAGGDGGGREGKVGGAARGESLDGARETCAALLFNLSTQVRMCRVACVAMFCLFPWVCS